MPELEPEMEAITLEADHEQVGSWQSSKQWAQMVRRHRRRMRMEKFLECNPLAWFFNELPPQDMYRASADNRRTTRQEMRYHWLRQRTSWTFWSHLKTATGIRFAAVGGLVSAFFQAAPGLRGQESNVEPFNWLLIAGLLYLFAVMWFEVFCPLLLKQSLSDKPRYLGQHNRRWLQALVEDEFRRWWVKREWWPNPDILDEESSHDKTVMVIMAGYGVPAFAGFNTYACAHIERALHEYSQITNISIWRRDNYDNTLRKFDPQYGYEGNRPFVRRLSLRRLDSYDIENFDDAKIGDIELRWFNSQVDISHRLPSRKLVNIACEAEGLSYLFVDDHSATTFSEIIAFWQDSMHPARRFVLMTLFSLSAAAFFWFVFLQLNIVLSGI